MVLALGAQGVAGLNLPASSGPSVTMASHPSDPAAKLLIISGRDARELKRAATALAVGAPALSGPTAMISEFKQIEARKPTTRPTGCQGPPGQVRRAGAKGDAQHVGPCARTSSA